MRKGFTLLELLISICGGVIILFGVLNLFSAARVAISASGGRSELTQNGRIALERLARDIRQAETLVTNLPETDSDPQNPPTSEIEFQDGHDAEVLTYIRYYLTGQTLYRETLFYSFPAEPTVHVIFNSRNEFNELPMRNTIEQAIVAEHAAEIKFFGDSLINIKITLSNNSETITMPTTIFGRNTTGT
ncbi:hypothetical protein HZA71_02150 [Candidatus Falkowbacteria bacterium]|nr:hypothetical protein [Candidatus Falkowbacteria bacterium]